MNDDDYLWDRSGPPDPEVERLETLLRPLGHQESGSIPLVRLDAETTVRLKPDTTYVSAEHTPTFVSGAQTATFVSGAQTATHVSAAQTATHVSAAQTSTHVSATSTAGAKSLRYIPALAAAALIAIVAGGWWMVSPSRPQTPGWEVTTIEGAPTIASRSILSRSELPVGDWLETNERSQAGISVAGLGRIEIGPRTRVGLVSARAGDYRLNLERGTLHAVISAPAGQFFVETPSSLTVDLGCAYTLTVDEAGRGLVLVTAGWVGFEWQGRESFIPAGFVGATRPGVGPGTPYHERASSDVRAALELIDFSGESPETGPALSRVLAEAGERDEVTLWHLLTRVPAGERDRVFDRLARFVPPPVSVTREGIRLERRDMLDAWWDAMGLGTMSLWRTWKQAWPGGPTSK